MKHRSNLERDLRSPCTWAILAIAAAQLLLLMAPLTELWARASLTGLLLAAGALIFTGQAQYLMQLERLAEDLDNHTFVLRAFGRTIDKDGQP